MDDTANTPEPQEEVTEAPVEPKEEVKDRTKEQFEKLTQSNQELKEERDSYKNLFEALRPAEVPQETQEHYQEPINQAPAAQNFQNLNQNQVNDVFQGMVDENGYLDGNKLMTRLNELDQRALKAEERAHQVEQKQRENEQKAREKEEKDGQAQVYAKYEQLNPDSDKFDEKFWQYTYNELAVKAKRGEMPSGVDYMAAADKVYKDLYEGRQDVTKEEREKQEETEQAKTVINATRPRSSLMKDYYAQDNEENLLSAVRAGKRGAVAEALRRLENPQE